VVDTQLLVTDRAHLAYARRRLQADPRLREVYANADAVVYEVGRSAEIFADGRRPAYNREK
jgi:hypothetical protein